MPNTASAKKAHRQSLTHRSRNRHFLELYRESVKKLERAILGSAPIARDVVDPLLSSVYSRVDTLTKKNIIHRNNASRRKEHFAAVAKAAVLRGS